MSTYFKKHGLSVIRKYGNKCWYCGITLNHTNKAIDHFVSIKEGGSNDISNLRPACRSCNSQKGSSDIELFRYRKRIEKAGLPKFLTTTIVKYIEEELQVSLNLPEHVFFFERILSSTDKSQTKDKNCQ